VSLLRIILIAAVIIASDCTVSCADAVSSMAAAADADQHPLFSRVLYNDIRDGEFFSVFNPSRETLALSNWTVSDGEGSICFPSSCVIAARSEAVVARNASRFLEQNGRLPDFSLSPNPLGVRTLSAVGAFRLANDGDELILSDPGDDIIDALAFGPAGSTGDIAGCWHGPSIPSPGRSRILVRQSEAGAFMDSDSSVDWVALRDYRPGQSSFSPHESQARVTCLLMPDHSDLVIQRISEARESLEICSYEFDSWQVYSALNESLSKGVSVRMLLEGSPAGGISNKSVWLLSALVSRGAEVYLMRTPDEKDSLRRYSYVHSKYIVIDRNSIIVMSENLVYNAFDTELGRGNRGWAAMIESPILAKHLSSLFASDVDMRFRDVQRFDLAAPHERPPDTATRIPHRIVGRIPLTSDCGVKLFAFPDCTGRRTVIQGLINGSGESFFAELFYADTYWSAPMLGEVESPLIREMAQLARKAGEFYVCLDNNSLFSDGDNRNGQALARLETALPYRSGGSRVGFPPHNAPFEIVHNKGMVLDHRYSWISSVNWNYESTCANREVAVLVDDPAIAGFYEDCIKTDLGGESDPPVMQPRLEMSKDRSAWELTLSGSSDGTGIKRAEFETGDGERHSWSCMIPADSRSVMISVNATDLWGNTAECGLLLFPEDPPTVASFSGISEGHAVSGLSAAAMLAIVCLHLCRRRVRNNTAEKGGRRWRSNVIYAGSGNLLPHDDKGIQPGRCLQGRGHHSFDAQRSLSDILLPERLPILARRLPRRGEGRGGRRIHNGGVLRRAPGEDPHARRQGAASQGGHRLDPDKVIRILEHAERGGLGDPRGQGEQRHSDEPLFEARFQNNGLPPRLLPGRGGRP